MKITSNNWLVEIFHSETEILNLDFSVFKKSNGCLLHFQAKPRCKRTFGVFDVGVMKYYCLDPTKTVISCRNPILLTVDESIIQTAPSSVIYFPNSKVYQKNGKLLIFSIC